MINNGGKNKETKKQVTIKKYSNNILRKLIAIPLKISFNSCLKLNGKVLPVNFLLLFLKARQTPVIRSLIKHI